MAVTNPHSVPAGLDGSCIAHPFLDSIREAPVKIVRKLPSSLLGSGGTMSICANGRDRQFHWRRPCQRLRSGAPTAPFPHSTETAMTATSTDLSLVLARLDK